MPTANVLLIGDSVTNDYSGHVQSALTAAGYNTDAVHFTLEQVRTASALLAALPARLAEAALWDVICVNAGLWDVARKELTGSDSLPDMRTRPEDYAAAMYNLLCGCVAAPGSPAVILNLTTPVPHGAWRHRNDDIENLNNIARSVAETLPDIWVNDLYSLTKPNMPRWQRAEDDIHFNSDGERAQGEHVARWVLRALAEA